jgi:hypothetical protein
MLIGGYKNNVLKIDRIEGFPFQNYFLRITYSFSFIINKHHKNKIMVNLHDKWLNNKKFRVISMFSNMHFGLELELIPCLAFYSLICFSY